MYVTDLELSPTTNMEQVILVNFMYRGRRVLLEGTMVSWDYNHFLSFTIDGTEIIFRPGENGNYYMDEIENGNTPPDPGLLDALIRLLNCFRKVS